MASSVSVSGMGSGYGWQGEWGCELASPPELLSEHEDLNTES